MIKLFFLLLAMPCSAAVLHFNKVVDPAKLDSELRAVGVYISYDGKTKANGHMTYSAGELDITIYREKDFEDDFKASAYKIGVATTTKTDLIITTVVNNHVP